MATRAVTFTLRNSCSLVIQAQEAVLAAQAVELRSDTAPAEVLAALDSANQTCLSIIRQLGNSSSSGFPMTSPLIANMSAVASSGATAASSPLPIPSDELYMNYGYVQELQASLQSRWEQLRNLQAQPAATPHLTDRATPITATATTTAPAAASSSSTESSPLISADHADALDSEHIDRVYYFHAFERAVCAREFDVDVVERTYNWLDQTQKMVINELIWMAAGYPDTFSARNIIEEGSPANRKILQKAVKMLQAQRKLATFGAAIANLNIQATEPESTAQAMERFYDRLARNDEDRVGIRAQWALVHACAHMRGMGPREDHEDPRSYAARAIGNFDEVTRNAVAALTRRPSPPPYDRDREVTFYSAWNWSGFSTYATP